jgi:hypothetical protein
MPTDTTRRAAAVGIAAAALTAVTALGPGIASADTASVTSPETVTACAPGMVPLTNQNTWVRHGPGFEFVTKYTLQSGSGFRILAGPSTGDGLVWWYGNGNGKDYGWVPDQNLTCH